MIVADTNLFVALAVKGPQSSAGLRVWQKDNEWATTPLWESEFRSALIVLMRAGVMGEKTALAAFHFAAERARVYQVSTAAVIRLAENYKLTAYDAEFAALAEWLDVAAVSFDPDLVNAGLAIHPKDF